MTVSHLTDCAPSASDFLHDVLKGLSSSPKALPCKYFYDARGSQLFDQICELEEYYPARTEIEIMHAHAQEMARLIGPDALLIEFGSGSSIKTRVLLAKLRDLAGYVPLDISRDHLLKTAHQLAHSFPGLEILPLCADYNDSFLLPAPQRAVRRNVVYFPGSTIGNLHPAQAEALLRRILKICGKDGALLIGVDLKKDVRILEAAYNDRARVTEEFNKNLLRRINEELDADFSIANFEHCAWFNTSAGRIEMHLVSKMPQRIHIDGSAEFILARDESIRTECSYKYDVEEFRALATRSGFRVEHIWTDARQFFSVQFLLA